MAVTPLTEDEMDKMYRTSGARWPRGVFLHCQCGRVGSVGDVSSHRTAASRRSEPSLCTRDPDAFLTLEDAELYELEQGAALRQAEHDEMDRNRAETLRLEHGVDDDAEARDDPTPEKRPPGRPRKDGTPAGSPRVEVPKGGHHGSGGSIAAGMERVEVPRGLTSRITGEVDVDVLERCNRVRLNPEFGFRGDIIEYLCDVERAYWIVIDWLAAGQPCPLAEFQTAA
jgi:hypothetical protein